MVWYVMVYHVCHGVSCMSWCISCMSWYIMYVMVYHVCHGISCMSWYVMYVMVYPTWPPHRKLSLILEIFESQLLRQNWRLD